MAEQTLEQLDRKLDVLFDRLRANEVPNKPAGERLSPQEIETFAQIFPPDRCGH